MGKEYTRVSIDVGPWVLGFSGLDATLWYEYRKETNAYLEQYVGDDGIHLIDQFEEGVLGQMFQSELPLGHVTWIGFTKNGVPVTRNDLTALQGRPHVLTDGLI